MSANYGELVARKRNGLVGGAEHKGVEINQRFW